MIKKVLASLLIGLSIVSFSDAFNIYPGLSPQQDFELGYSEEINNDGQGNYFELKSDANLLLNDNLRVFKYGDNNKGGWLFWNNGKLYILVVRAGNISQQGYVNKFCVANYGKVATCSENDIDLFYNDGVKYSQPDSFYYWENIQYTAEFSVCFGYSDLEYNICFGNNYLGSGLNIGIGDLNNLSSLYGYSHFGYGIENVPIEVGSGNGLDGYVYIPVNTGDYIDYFENERGFNSDICYIGTTDLVSNYGSGTQYYQGSGYTIFDFYYHLFNESNISISEEGTFINTWIVNYDTFFLGLNKDASGNPWFVDYYNGPGDYGVNRGPGLISPFTNNKVAYYFMASTIRDLISDGGSIGEEVALYCYKKGLSGSYNISDDHDSVYDNRVGVYKRNSDAGYFGSNGEEIVGQSRHGTPLDEMNWYNFTGAEDMDFKTFLSTAFNQFKVNYGTFDSSSVGLGALPTYIVMFLMALILFRFISH